MMYARPLGRLQRFAHRPVPVYANSREGAEREGKASFTPPTGLGDCMGVVKGQMCCVNSDSDFLGQCKVRKRCPACLDGLIAGPAEVEGGSCSMVCLDITLPLELRVTQVENFLKGAVGRDPCGYGCRGGILEEGP